MKNALILHATANNPDGNWYKWLSQELEEIGYKVWLPTLPKAEKPNSTTYTKFILANRQWEFNDQSIIIGHSSGAVETLYLLQHLPKETMINTAFLVSVFRDDLGWPVLGELFQAPFDFKSIKQRAKKFIFIHADNDPYSPSEHAEYLSQQVGGKLIILNGQKHFNLEKGPEYKQFPKLLQLIKENT